MLKTIQLSEKKYVVCIFLVHIVKFLKIAQISRFLQLQKN